CRRAIGSKFQHCKAVSIELACNCKLGTLNEHRRIVDSVQGFIGIVIGKNRNSAVSKTSTASKARIGLINAKIVLMPPEPRRDWSASPRQQLIRAQQL